MSPAGAWSTCSAISVSARSPWHGWAPRSHVDFSAPAIDLAQSLAEETGLQARFVCCDLDSTLEHVHDRFDIVYSAYGVLSWLPDLARWAQIVAALLAPEGRLHLLELHPATCMFDDETTDLRFRYPYFRGSEPIRIQRTGSYASPEAETQTNVTYSWPTAVSDVQTAILDAGLAIRSFHEYNSCPEQLRPLLVQGPDGRWRAAPGLPDLPLVYALSATRAI